MPTQRVVAARTITGPRGGLILVVRFACGHQQWRRVQREPRRPTTQGLCTGCWVDAAMAHPEVL